MEKHRTSVYTIFIELENDENYSLLVHGYTGAIDKVSKRVWNILKSKNIIFENTWNLSSQIFENLKKRGYITDKSPIEEKEVVKNMATVFHKRDSFMKNFMFLVAYDCNFRCPYCFENEISNNGRGWSKKVFTKDSVDRAYQAMLEFEPNTELHSKKIILYGGEPLLKQNKEIIKYIVSKGNNHGYHFTAITNGYDLEHFIDLLSPDKINHLQISIDGTEEKHNNRRTHFSDGKSFQKIMNNIVFALKKDISVSIRVNTELNNFEDLKVLKNLFTDLSFYSYKKFSAYSALIHGEDEMNCNTIMANTVNTETETNNTFVQYDQKNDPFQQYIDFEHEEKIFNNIISYYDEISNINDNLETMNRGKFVRKYLESINNDESMKLISCQDFGIRQKINSALKNKKPVEFRSVFCSAQTGELIFDPYGDLYSCWETVGIDEYKVGTYRNELKLNETELENWYGRNISMTPACSKCKYAFFCGGGCQAHALKEGRGYKSPYCDGYPKAFHQIVSDCFVKFESNTNSIV
ncbi:radical SAM protein [Elizabethkingia occulta]|uniref:radical SAM protein n=1 Tax=Elizabethkingia occulta TaxID=1867263 RepID=UPI00398C61DE